MAELPAYKPSGAGGQVDLKNIITSQIIAWGGYKSKLGRQYRATSGTFWYNGKEYFNNVDITGAVSNSNSEGYKLMEMFGFTEDSMKELSAQINDWDANRIEEATLEYNSSIDKEQDSFEMMIDFFLEKIEEFDYMNLSLRNIMYENGTPEPTVIGPRNMGISYTTQENILRHKDWIYDEYDSSSKYPGAKDWYFSQYAAVTNSYQPILSATVPVQAKPNSTRLMNNLSINVYKNGVNVSSKYSRQFLQFCAFIAIVEPTMVTESNQRITRSTKEVTNEYYKEVDSIDDSGMYKGDVFWKELIVSNTYTFDNMDEHSLYTKYPYYVTTCAKQGTCSSKATQSEKDEPIPSFLYPALLWEFVSPEIQGNLDISTNGLFSHVKWGCKNRLDYVTGELIEYCDYSKIHMSVEGLRRAQPGDFGFYVSQFMTINYKQKKQSWLKRFIGGLIKAFLNFIDAVIGIFLKIPVLKQIVEVVLSVIGSIFGVDADSAIAILGQIILAVVITLVAPYTLGTMGLGGAVTATSLLPGLTTGISTLVTYSSYAMQFYNIGMQEKMIGEAEEHAIESADRQYEIEKAQAAMDKVKQAFSGTMGTAEEHASKDMMMYEIMFNPFFYHPQAIPAEETPRLEIIR